MIAAAVAVAAIASNAATIKWDSGAMFFDATTGSTSSGTAMDKDHRADFSLYYIEKGQYDAILAQIVTEGAYNTENAISVYKSAPTTYTLANSVQTSKKGGAATLTDGLDKTDGTTYYALITAKYTDGGKDYAFVNVASKTMGPAEATVNKVGLLVGGEGGTIATKWAVVSDVPEPTSAMLLLLGVAGLALRRRRA